MPALMDDTALRLTGQDRVLVIRLGAVGDVLRTLPALHLIRQAYPDVNLTWIVEDLSRDLLLGHPEIDEVLRLPRRELKEAAVSPLHFVKGLKELKRDLRRRRFTVALDFQGSFKSGVLSWMSGAPRRVGFAPGHCREMSFLFTNLHVRPRAQRLNRVEKNLALAEAVGAAGDEVAVVLPESPEEGERAASILRDAAPRGEAVAVLSPGTSRRQAHKRWPAERYARLAALLRDTLGAVPLVAWGPGEETVARVIVEGSSGRAHVAPATSLRVLAAILRRAGVFIGADTGPMHLAWAVGCPVVALFGPTDPGLNAPLGPGNAILRVGRSMADLSPEQVLAAARSILARPRRPGGAGWPARWSRHHLFGSAAGAQP